MDARAHTQGDRYKPASVVSVYEAIHGLKKSLSDVREGRWKAEMELRSCQAVIEQLKKREKDLMAGEGSKQQVRGSACLARGSVCFGVHAAPFALVCTRLRLLWCACVCGSAHMCICVHVHVYMHVYLYMHVHVYIFS